MVHPGADRVEGLAAVGGVLLKGEHDAARVDEHLLDPAGPAEVLEDAEAEDVAVPGSAHRQVAAPRARRGRSAGFQASAVTHVWGRHRPGPIRGARQRGTDDPRGEQDAGAGG